MTLPPTPRRPGRNRAIAMVAAAAVVVTGAAVSYAAVRDQHGGGAASPQAAVRAIVDDLTKSDLLGVLDDLPPAERSSLRDSYISAVGELKRLKVLQPSADPGRADGLDLSVRGLTMAANDMVVSDHVHVVTLTGGVITVNSDASKIPYTKEFLDAAFDGHAQRATSTQTYDLSKTAGRSGQPARVAVQKVDGRWYASLMYTAVDAFVQDAGIGQPGPGDAIAAAGAPSAEDAVRRMITAANTSDGRSVIALLDPRESAALHDYGALLTRDAQRSDDPAFDVKAVSFTTSDVAGGTRVSIRSVTVVVDGIEQSYTVDGTCVVVSIGARTQRVCAADAIRLLGPGLSLSPAEEAAVGDLIAALPRIGVIATKTDGAWFISPLRTYADLAPTVLSNLKTDDLLALVRLARRR